MSGTHVASAQARDRRVKFGKSLGFARRGRIGKRRFDFGHQGVRLRERDVGPLNHYRCAAMPQGRCNLRTGERPETRDRNRAHRHSLRPQVVDRALGGLHHGTHSDERVVGVFHPVRPDQVVVAAGEFRVLFHGGAHRRFHAIVEEALRDAPLHVAFLVLDDAAL